MAGGRQREIDPQRETAKPCIFSPESDSQRRRGQKSGKYKGVRKSAVTPKVAIMDPKSKSNDVEIGDYGAECAGNPDAFWSARPVEACADAEGCNCM